MFWKPPGASCVPYLAAAALLAISPVTNAQSPSVTVYYAPGLTPLANGTVPTASVIPTAYDASLQAYSNVTLSPPAPPAATAISTSFAIPVPSAVPAGASMQHNGSFFGFSVEMSVVNQVLGKNSSLLQVPFLNLMANLQSRVGRINVRVGGNTQETAALVASTPDGRILEKDLSPGAASGTTQTPPIIFTPDLIQMMRNISSFVNVHWFLGVPFNDTNWRLEIIETGQAILGDFLIGMQAGNEPDLYSTHGRRPANYSEDDYFNEFGSLIQAIESDPNANASKLLIAPSVSTFWTPAQALFAGTQFLPTYGSNMEAVAVEHYPFDNCGVKFPTSGEQIQNPQDLLSVYLSHNATAQIIQPYLNISAYIQSNNFPFYMFETNTGSCGGFPGLSDAFVAALWGVDYGMQMAFANFSTALFHIGGQSVSYNPFTPAPTNESTFHEWTVGPIYYSSLVVAEALGATGTAQIIDLGTENDLTPAYAIWENGAPARVLILNFANDASGASQISVDISIPGAQLPSQVDVKYLLADDVTQKGNYTWAGQTFGGNFESDGRPIGSENITQATCGTVCTITVPAPGVALVFLSGRASSADTAADASTTFSTSSVTKTQNTVSVNPTLLADSNGHGGSQQPLQLGSTSQGSFKNAATSTAPVSKWTSLIMAVVVGMIAFWRP